MIKPDAMSDREWLLRFKPGARVQYCGSIPARLTGKHGTIRDAVPEMGQYRVDFDGAVNDPQTVHSSHLNYATRSLTEYGAVPDVIESTVGAAMVQVGGEHYTKLPIQPMQYSMANKLDALQHSIVKYVTRFRDKDGVRDLEKAKHCIDMLIEYEAKNAVQN